MPQGPLKDVDQLVQTEGREKGRRFAKKPYLTTRWWFIIHA